MAVQLHAPTRLQATKTLPLPSLLAPNGNNVGLKGPADRFALKSSFFSPSLHLLIASYISSSLLHLLHQDSPCVLQPSKPTSVEIAGIFTMTGNPLTNCLIITSALVSYCHLWNVKFPLKKNCRLITHL
ncbi:hypothetical protein OIU85_009645 [Salix viminalis]|uniref:Uncharacterized protein n=1 Tax=Salix viminalis TaxID=40686 RepID=A0A9Q0SGN4_SALVM|nr:hypothetical protein OIU85_009645 [Salix viminalis]